MFGIKYVESRAQSHSAFNLQVGTRLLACVKFVPMRALRLARSSGISLLRRSAIGDRMMENRVSRESELSLRDVSVIKFHSGNEISGTIAGEVSTVTPPSLSGD